MLVRFAPQMDMAGSSPWSVADADAYKLAYQHYHDAFTALGVVNVQWVWSPAGNTTAPAYYPSDAYVDHIGLSVLSAKEWDAQNGNPNASSFAALFSDKYAVVKPYGKPIIAEVGVSGLPDYKRQWLSDAFRSLGNYPLLRGIVYFNSYNAANAGQGNEPDFRIGADMIWSVEDAR